MQKTIPRLDCAAINFTHDVLLTSSIHTPPGYEYQFKLFRGEWYSLPLLSLLSILIFKRVYTVSYFAVALDYRCDPFAGKGILCVNEN